MPPSDTDNLPLAEPVGMGADQRLGYLRQAWVNFDTIEPVSDISWSSASGAHPFRNEGKESSSSGGGIEDVVAPQVEAVLNRHIYDGIR